MSFVRKHNSITIHTDLTQEGAYRLANGDLSISRIAFSDAEIDYGFGRNSGDTYSSSTGLTYSPDVNNVFSSSYRRKWNGITNFDGTPPFTIDSENIYGTTEVIVEPVDSIGFFSSTTNSGALTDYRIKTEMAISTGWTTTSFCGSTFGFASNGINRMQLSGDTVQPPLEGLLYIRFISPTAVGVPGKNEQNIGYYANFYRYTYDPVQKIISVDRPIPRFNQNFTIKEQPIWFYPLTGYSTYYGSGTTEPCPIWNMNILTKMQHIGHGKSTNLNTSVNTTNYDIYATRNTIHQKYGSKHISGIVRSLGLEDELSCAIIHYTNSYSGSVYGDSLVPKETILDLPNVLWHRNWSGVAGNCIVGGLKLTDSDSEIYYDNKSGLNYTLIKDGVGPSSLAVGRVYFDKKLIALTDPELVTALDPKTNRNWTCPPLQLDLISQTDNDLIRTSGFTGIAEAGKRYYITYHMTSYPGQGARQSIPCSYVQTIDGKLGNDGQPMYIRASLPPNSFPFVRVPSILSGAGINCQWIRILVQEFDIEDDPGIFDLDPFKWRISTLFGATKYQGVSAAYMTSSEVNRSVFILNREEYDTYYKYFLMYEDTVSTGIGQALGMDKALWPGDTDFLFGNVTAKSQKKNYVRNINFQLDKSALNTTFNPTYTSGSTFITEVLLLGEDDKVLGIGKPDRPIKKNDATFIDLTLKSYY